MLKRIFDIMFSCVGLIMSMPLLLVSILFVWLYDKGSPFYIATRVGVGEKLFRMYKLRSMHINADKSGVDSTSETDSRITPIGRLVRKCKLDELVQLVNVLKGDMSIVGPRPNVKREVDLYTGEEKKLLSIKPGITDISSIIFSDLGGILANKDDPDIAYNQLVRPWKGRLGIFYIENRSFSVDLLIVLITALSIVNRNFALHCVHRLLQSLQADQQLLDIALREKPLKPMPPIGSLNIVTTRIQH